MKKTSWICIGLVFVAILLTVRRIQNSKISAPDKTVASATNSPISIAETKTSARQVPASKKIMAVNDRDKPEAFKQSIEEKNSPIEFYGKVVDQDGNGLSDALVKSTIRQWYVRSLVAFDVGAHFIPIERKTEAGGRFEIHGEKGDGFGIAITKDGYELEPNRYGFGPTAGSYDNPVIFKMWSTNIHEQLITGGKPFDIIPDGRPYFINLADDTISESGEGDLKVWIQYTNQVVRGQLYDWSAGIEVVNGGLCPSDVYAMFSAPDVGYVPIFRLEQQIKGGQSGEIGERRFYLRLKNGQEFGKMTINLYAPFNNQNPGMIRISYAINPSGSRILR